MYKIQLSKKREQALISTLIKNQIKPEKLSKKIFDIENTKPPTTFHVIMTDEVTKSEKILGQFHAIPSSHKNEDTYCVIFVCNKKEGLSSSPYNGIVQFKKRSANDGSGDIINEMSITSLVAREYHIRFIGNYLENFPVAIKIKNKKGGDEKIAGAITKGHWSALCDHIKRYTGARI